MSEFSPASTHDDTKAKFSCLCLTGHENEVRYSIFFPQQPRPVDPTPLHKEESAGEFGAVRS